MERVQLDLNLNREGYLRPPCLFHARVRSEDTLPLWSKHLDFLPAHPGWTLLRDDAEKAHVFQRVVRFELEYLTVDRVSFEGVQEIKLIGRGSNPKLVEGIAGGGSGDRTMKERIARFIVAVLGQGSK